VIGEKGHSPPDPVGRRSRRAEGVENSVHETAPDLSRTEEVASPRGHHLVPIARIEEIL